MAPALMPLHAFWQTVPPQKCPLGHSRLVPDCSNPFLCRLSTWWNTRSLTKARPLLVCPTWRWIANCGTPWRAIWTAWLSQFARTSGQPERTAAVDHGRPRWAVDCAKQRFDRQLEPLRELGLKLFRGPNFHGPRRTSPRCSFEARAALPPAGERSSAPLGATTAPPSSRCRVAWKGAAWLLPAFDEPARPLGARV
jgi:hypothetical protein